MKQRYRRGPFTLVSLALLLTILLIAACSEAPPSDPRPNVVLIVVDTLRADRLPFYGAPRNTAPFLEQLASESWVFDNAFSPSSWTLPSMVSTFTSVHPYQHGVVSLEGLELEQGQDPVPINCIPDEVETRAEVLQANGYRTFGVASNLLLTEEVGFSRGFDRYVYLDDEPADRVNAQAELWREEMRQSEPYFLYLHDVVRDPWSAKTSPNRCQGWSRIFRVASRSWIARRPTQARPACRRQPMRRCSRGCAPSGIWGRGDR